MNLFDIVVAKALAGSSGGGGSSDFSTATMTVVMNGTTSLVSILVPCAMTIEEDDFASAFYDTEVLRDESPNITTCILYKGMAVAHFNCDPSKISATGSVEFEGTDAFITGDCTITIS